MRSFALTLVVLVTIAAVAAAAPDWQEYAPYAKGLAPLDPTPAGEGHLGLVESGQTVQVRFSVPAQTAAAYRVQLSNVVAYSGKGTSYQLVIRHGAADGPVVYEGPVIDDGDAWNVTNRELVDLTAALTAEDRKQGYVDLYVTGLVTGDGWTLYKQHPGRPLAAFAVVLSPEMERQVAAGRAMAERGVALLPLPQECRLGAGEVALQGLAAARPPGTDAAVDMLREALRALGGPVPQGPAANVFFARADQAAELGRLRKLGFAAKPSGHREGYTLEVTGKGAVVVGDDQPGLFYGVATLGQLLRRSGEKVTAPEVLIRDWPAYPLRGFQYDIARGQTVDVAFCKRVIRETARHKMNCIMFYLEDDYRFEKYPFTGRPGTFDKAKAQELSRYADLYHVMLIPQYESLGHAGAVLSHPEFKDLREGNSAWVFCTSEPKVWQFLDDAYAELAEAFPNSKYLHVGGDEFEGPFGTCPRCRAVREKDGLGALYVQHMNKLNELCRKYHRTMLFWPSHRGPSEEESYLTLKNAAAMQRDCIPTEWIYHGPAAYPEIEQYQQAGFADVCVSPAVVSYSVIWPDYPTTFRGIRGFYQAGAERKCGLALCTTWEFMYGALIENSMYGLIYAAECGWSLGRGSRQDYNRRFAADWFGLRDPAAAALLEDAIYLPIPTTGPAARWRDGRLVRDLFWAGPDGFRRQYMQRQPQLLQQSADLDKAATAALERLAALRGAAKTNTITLDFAEVGLRMHRYDAAKLAAFDKAARLYDQARTQAAANQAAEAKQSLKDTAAALRALLPELAYFTERFGFAVDKCGAWEGDLKNLRAQTTGLENLVAKVEALAAGDLAALPPAEQLGLGLRPCTRIGEWEPKQMSEEGTELRYDLSALLTGPGTYVVECEYTQGAHGLQLRGARLTADGQVVAEDAHGGWTGAGSSGNVYTFKLGQVEAGKKYELIVSAVSRGGTDSHGELWLTKD